MDDITLIFFMFLGVPLLLGCFIGFILSLVGMIPSGIVIVKKILKVAKSDAVEGKVVDIEKYQKDEYSPVQLVHTVEYLVNNVVFRTKEIKLGKKYQIDSVVNLRYDLDNPNIVRKDKAWSLALSIVVFVISSFIFLSSIAIALFVYQCFF